jgi:hypothetical protein
VGERDIYLLQNVQTASGAHTASYSVGAGVAFPGVKWPGREVIHSPSSSGEVGCSCAPPV